MYLSLLALTVLLAGTALSNPSLVKRDMTLAKRVPQYITPPARMSCQQRPPSFENTKVASSASVFCSTYIQSTTRTTVTATFSETVIVDIHQFTVETSTAVTTTLSTITTTTSTSASLPTQTCAAAKIGCVSENSVTAGKNAPTANECYTICGQTTGCVAFQYRTVSLATNCNLLSVSAAQAFLSNTGNAGTGDKCNTAHIYNFHTPPC